MTNDVIDEAALDKLLHALGGDPEDLYELMDDFDTIGPQLIAELDRAAETSDWKSMRVSAHSLKSNAREFGAGNLESLCQTLEQQCNEQTVHQPEQQIELINESFAQARQSLAEIKQRRA